MSVDLTELRLTEDAIAPVMFGGLMPSALGGSTSRFGRLGDRYSAQVTTPPMAIEPHGRRWSAKLQRAMREGGLVRIHQPDFKIGAPGQPVVASPVAAGRQIPIAGLTPGYAIREGQWLNYFDDNGQRYLDQVQDQVIASASGTTTVTIHNLIRAPLAAGVVVDFRACLEGWIEGDFSIPRTVDRLTSFSFTISEKS